MDYGFCRGLNPGIQIQSLLCYPLHHDLWLVGNTWRLPIFANFQIWWSLALYRGMLQIFHFLKRCFSHEMISRINQRWIAQTFLNLFAIYTIKKLLHVFKFILWNTTYDPIKRKWVDKKWLRPTKLRHDDALHTRLNLLYRRRLAWLHEIKELLRFVGGLLKKMWFLLKVYTIKLQKWSLRIVKTRTWKKNPKI